MARHTSNPQPQAVERKNKSPADSKSNLAGAEHNKGIKGQKTLNKP